MEGLERIQEVAVRAGLDAADIIPYGRYFAKVDLGVDPAPQPGSKVILVTAMTPTKAGEGKTTTAIALTDGLNRVLEGTGKRATVALRQPSMGPVFGLKGGATGGGEASVLPSDEININFTGDIHALTAANALISAVIDNSIFHGNPLGIDLDRVVLPRAVDMNDRALRRIRVGIDKKHPEGHLETTVITAASELMAIFCLARSEDDFAQRVNDIVCAYTLDGRPVRVGEFRIENAIRKIVREALLPNIAQTKYGSLAFIHGGPFANIAHGCCSIRAIQAGLHTSDYCVTEAGFGADLGGEKFMDLLCPRAGIAPACTVVVASVRSCKLQGGVSYENLGVEDVSATVAGAANLLHHLRVMSGYGVPVICCINAFDSDSQSEIAALKMEVEKAGFNAVCCRGYTEGPEGSVDLARAVIATCEKPSAFKPLVKPGQEIRSAVTTICQQVYGAEGVSFSPRAETDIASIESMGLEGLGVCIAKTPLSLTDDPAVLGCPRGFTINISSVRLSAGAGFVVPVSGSTLLMPGLPSVPAAVDMED